MGIIRALGQATAGGFADQWLEVYEANDMGERTVFTNGVLIRRGQNVKGTNDTVSNGSIIHVYDNQFMMLVDGGKVVDYTAEPGYYKVDNSSMPSLFNGQFGDTLKEAFNRTLKSDRTGTVLFLIVRNLRLVNPDLRIDLPHPGRPVIRDLILHLGAQIFPVIGNPPDVPCRHRRKRGNKQVLRQLAEFIQMKIRKIFCNLRRKNPGHRRDGFRCLGQHIRLAADPVGK